MAHDHDHETGSPHGGTCSLSGCGEVEASTRFDDESTKATVAGRQEDRLLHMDEIDQKTMDEFLTARGRERRSALKIGGALGAMAAVGPLFEGVARAAPRRLDSRSEKTLFSSDSGGRTYVVESNTQNVHLGVIDTTLSNILEVESGDYVVYPNTWSHFLNQMQPGVTIDQLAAWRVANPGKGPHSIIGPVGVRGAEPGDMIEIQYHRLLPTYWAANFNNPGYLGTGALPDLFPTGQVKYFDLDLQDMSTHFNDDIRLTLAPFQGTLGLAPPAGWIGNTSGVFSSVPPGPHAGNLDLRELNEGTRLFIPVWQSGGRIYTGDSHALQGDGEVNLTALETAMQEVRIRVILHKQVGWQWPFAETETHWIALASDPDLGVAFRTALINAIDFLNVRAGLTRLDAYSLLSVAASFRITQVVNARRGVHAMIPKEIFDPRLRRFISVV